MSRRLVMWTLSVLVVPAVWHLGIWSPEPTGVDAISAVTPGYVAVVGAGSPTTPGAPADITIDGLVRGALYLAGGLHRFIDPSAEQILLRPSHAALDSGDTEQHLEVIGSVIDVLHEVTPEAQITLLSGGVPGSGVQIPGVLADRLQSLSAGRSYVDVLHLADAEAEVVEVPDGGLAAQLYPVPIALLECDAIVNIARYDGALTVARSLDGLAGPGQDSDPANKDGRLVDILLLAQPDITVVDMLGRAHPRSPVVLASADGVAIDRLVQAIRGDLQAAAVLQKAGERRLGMPTLANIKVGGIDVAGAWTRPPADAPR